MAAGTEREKKFRFRASGQGWAARRARIRVLRRMQITRPCMLMSVRGRSTGQLAVIVSRISTWDVQGF